MLIHNELLVIDGYFATSGCFHRGVRSYVIYHVIYCVIYALMW